MRYEKGPKPCFHVLYNSGLVLAGLLARPQLDYYLTTWVDSRGLPEGHDLRIYQTNVPERIRGWEPTGANTTVEFCRAYCGEVPSNWLSKAYGIIVMKTEATACPEPRGPQAPPNHDCNSPNRIRVYALSNETLAIDCIQSGRSSSSKTSTGYWVYPITWITSHGGSLSAPRSISTFEFTEELGTVLSGNEILQRIDRNGSCRRVRSNTQPASANKGQSSDASRPQCRW